MNIVKEKNLVKFHIEGKARPYIIDLNKGIIYGLRGIEIQSIPPAIYKAYIPAEERTSVLNLVREQYTPRHYASLYAFADKLDGIGYHAPAWELRQINRQLDEIDFKKLSKYLRETEDASLDQYMRVYAKELWREQKGLRIDDHFTEQMAEFLYDNFRTQSKEVLSIFAYYLSRGLWDFCRDRWEIHSRLDSFLTYMNALEWKMEKTDFFRAYINAKRAYTINRDALMDKGIKNYQMEHIKALTFEDDTFTVVIPTTNKELIAEGESQHNRVGGYGNSIVERRKNVVFIRYKAKPNVPFITCDIVDTGHINQYLTKYNRREYGDDAREFYHAFQEHLLANWGE
jgi:hypothetical protein